MYLFEPLLMNGPDWGSFHAEAISGGAMSLSKNLTHFNSKLLTFGSSPIDAVEQIRQRVNLSGFEVKEVFSHEETALTHTYERDNEFKNWCQNNSIQWHEFTNNGVIRGPIDRNHWEKRFVKYMMQERPKFHKDKLSASFPEKLKNIFQDKFYDNSETHRPSISASEYMNVSERSGNLILKDFLNN